MGRVRQAQVMNLKCSALLECKCRSAAAIRVYEVSCESRLADASPLPVPPQQGHEQHDPRYARIWMRSEMHGRHQSANTGFRGQITRL
jgi:hypothetical protein